MPFDDAAAQEHLNAANLAYIAIPEVREAYRMFMAEGALRDFETSVLASSGTKPLRFYRQLDGRRAYFFSCDRNQTHLRCYVRSPSLRASPDLRRVLVDDPKLETKELTGEVLVFVRNPEEARRLVDMVFGEAEPLHQGSAAPQTPRRYDLVADATACKEAFTEWFDALSGAVADVSDDGLLPCSGMGFRRLKPILGDELRVEFWIGDATASAVQINEPNTPGSENPLGGVAIDEEGRRYIVRQGVLHKNNVSGRIEAAAFAIRTGLVPVDMHVGDRPAGRQWHVVTALDDLADAAIAFNTADFVARCWRARGWDETTQADDERLQDLFGAEERGGWFDYVPDPSPRRVLRAQGEVWQALKHQLGSEGIRLEKPRHARGYEVDGEVDAIGGPLLIEMKSGVTAADYYCGVGQLMLYAALLPRLSDHRRILLLPEERASAVLEKALVPLDVEVHRYKLTRTPAISVRFSAIFLELCGLSRKGALEFAAF